MRAALAVLSLVAAARSGSVGAGVPPQATTFPIPAEAVCPLLWDWQREVGARIEMSAAATAEPSPEVRQGV